MSGYIKTTLTTGHDGENSCLASTNGNEPLLKDFVSGQLRLTHNIFDEPTDELVDPEFAWMPSD